MADALSQVLRSVRLAGGVFLDVRLTAPWAVTSHITADDCRPLLANPAQVIGFHVVLAGRMLAMLDGEPVREVQAGEIVLFPRSDVHVLASEPGLRPVAGHELVQPSPGGGLARIVHGGGGEPTHLVCGFLGCEEHGSPLIAALPRMLSLDVRKGTSHDWIEASVRFAAAELVAGRLATSEVMSRLSELLLVEAVRQYVASRPGDAEGWLRGLADPYVGKALALIHDRIERPWSADALAREVGMSRSAFVDRFTGLIGQPPIRYLTACRLQTACLQLRETDRPLARIAFDVGYDSTEAFSRAFKRQYGRSPAHWREADGHA
jgi:AraC-like DNA-binding protein